MVVLSIRIIRLSASLYRKIEFLPGTNETDHGEVTAWIAMPGISSCGVVGAVQAGQAGCSH
jgi:hypothetical protein